MNPSRAMRTSIFTLALLLFGNFSAIENSLAQQQISWTETPYIHRGNTGQQFTYICPSRDTLNISDAGWGTDIYTDDTPICPAAVHAGAITTSGGPVTIEIRPGQASYKGSTRNNATTRDYGNWGGSFVFVSQPSIPPSGEQVMNFDTFSVGPLAPNTVASQGITFVPEEGTPTVHKAEPNMVLPPDRSQVLLVDGGPQTRFSITFSAPIKRFSLTRIGTSGGASVPTWTLVAYDSQGNVVGSTGEEHGLPPQPNQFSVEGNNIVRVQLSTDNRFGAGTWATWNSLPVVEFRIQR